MLKILCAGPQWRGSNAGGLFKAFSRQGHIIEIIDEFYEIPLNANGLNTKVVSRLTRKMYIHDFNRKIIERCVSFKPDVFFIYKGAFILPETLKKIRGFNLLLVNFYPDVSFHTHGQYLKKSLPLYDIVFTTKSFGIADLKDQLDVQYPIFIPHGFDPDIHRPIDISKFDINSYKNDASFIGTWSSKKEKLLRYIVNVLPDLDLKIFGNQWEKSNEPILSKWFGAEVMGDQYALAINSSKINLGLLSEKIRGASSGDKITSRTFHIPASGGFLLHERTDEVIEYFKENIEIGCFGNPEELTHKIRYYLKNDSEREKIKEAGYKRALKDHSLDRRAVAVLKIINSKLEIV